MALAVGRPQPDEEMTRMLMTQVHKTAIYSASRGQDSVLFRLLWGGAAAVYSAARVSAFNRQLQLKGRSTQCKATPHRQLIETSIFTRDGYTKRILAIVQIVVRAHSKRQSNYSLVSS